MTKERKRTLWPSIGTKNISLSLPHSLSLSFTISQSWPIAHLITKAPRKNSLLVNFLIFCTVFTTIPLATCTSGHEELLKNQHQYNINMESTIIDLEDPQDDEAKMVSPSKGQHPRTSKPLVYPEDDVAILIEDDISDNTPRIRMKRQAVESTTTTTTPASTTACICPSTSTTMTTDGSSTTTTTFVQGTTTTEGLCICPGITDTTIEVETSTALPLNSFTGRKLRRELLEMETNQLKQDKLESKLFQNIPFLNM